VDLREIPALEDSPLGTRAALWLGASRFTPAGLPRRGKGQAPVSKKKYCMRNAKDLAGNTHVSMPTLARRGWTPAMVKAHLGPPDETAKNPHYACAAPMKLYSVLRVLRAEQQQSWVDDLALAAKRKAAAARGRATRKRNAKEAERKTLADVGILPAVFTVNRAAKRFRDDARQSYEWGDRRTAGEYAARKRELYDLKNQALAHLLREGELAIVGLHVLTSAGTRMAGSLRVTSPRSSRAMAIASTGPRGSNLTARRWFLLPKSPRSPSTTMSLRSKWRKRQCAATCKEKSMFRCTNGPVVGPLNGGTMWTRSANPSMTPVASVDCTMRLGSNRQA